IEDIRLLSSANTNNALTVFDTDEAYTSDASNIVAEIKNTINSETVPLHDRVYVRKGAYVQLAGTQPRATLRVGIVPTYNDAAVRNLGLRRTG
ncbi:hypothetical protein LCGC14_1909980, partial [marine sediment metagenome]